MLERRRCRQGHCGGRGFKLRQEFSVAVPDVNRAVLASDEDFPGVGCGAQAKRCVGRITQLTLLSGGRALLARVRFEIPISEGASAIGRSDDDSSPFRPGHGGNLANLDGSWLILEWRAAGYRRKDEEELYEESGLRGTSPPAEATSSIS